MNENNISLVNLIYTDWERWHIRVTLCGGLPSPQCENDFVWIATHSSHSNWGRGIPLQSVDFLCKVRHSRWIFRAYAVTRYMLAEDWGCIQLLLTHRWMHQFHCFHFVSLLDHSNRISSRECSSGIHCHQNSSYRCWWRLTLLLYYR